MTTDSDADAWVDRSNRIADLEGVLAECLAAVARYERLPPAQRSGRPLLVAFAEVQRHRRTVRELAELGHTIAPRLALSDEVAQGINAAMGAVVAAVVALPSIARSHDLPALRQALGLTEPQASARARERDAERARFVDHIMGLEVRRGVRRNLSEDAVFSIAAGGARCSKDTVRRAWIAAAGRESDTYRKWLALPLPPAAPPQLVAPVRKARPDRSKGKAAIDRAFTRKR